MADRESARLFAEIFCLLAQNPDDRNKDLALKIWAMTLEYDFNPYQMNCDDELVKLDLAYCYITDGDNRKNVCYKGDEKFIEEGLVPEKKVPSAENCWYRPSEKAWENYCTEHCHGIKPRLVQKIESINSEGFAVLEFCLWWWKVDDLELVDKECREEYIKEVNKIF